jgi:hypothetical protein
LIALKIKLRRNFGANEMSSTAIMTLTRMMETLPESAQNQAVEHLREYIATMQDERDWDELFESTQSQLIVAARQAKDEIAADKSKPMDFDRL